jgi:long-chain acyl-CoA synthetase
MLNEEIGIMVRDGEPASASTSATLPGLLLHSGDQYRKPDAFKIKKNGQWLNVSSDQFLSRVEELFFALRSLGVKPGDRVAIFSENRVEWAVTDYAALCAGAITVPIYPTLSAPQVEVLLRDSMPVAVFVSTAALLEKLSSIRAGLGIRYIVAFDESIYQPGIMRIDTLYEMGRQFTYDVPGEFRREALSIDPESVATIIYTSGTTGVPKGAMLTHRNLVSNVQATGEVLPLLPSDLSLSFLPLSHIFQRHVDYACMRAGVSIAYAESVTAVAENMIELRPTFAAGVPRFFEKVYGRIMSEVSRAPAVRRAIFEKAVRLGKECLRDGHTSVACRAADRVVFQKIRHRLGGRVRFFISGGAALDKEIAEFFCAIGLPIYEGYGLSETSPVISLNTPGATRLGSVGRVVGNQEVKIAADGEILVRGSNVMKGYYRMERETEEALAGGWFHTGDIGEFDADGYLKITDRKKDLIVTSSGKNVAPQAIENRLKTIPYFESVVVIGDHRKFVSALIVPNYDALARLARNHGVAFDRPSELVRNRKIYELVMNEIDRHTADLSAFEKVKKIAFLEKEFTIDGGELTPTLKIRRSTIEQKYQTTIDQLYAA